MRLVVDSGPEDETCAAVLRWAEPRLAALPDAVRDRVLLALGESVANAVRHGLGRVEVELEVLPTHARLAVHDAARGLQASWLAAASLPPAEQRHGRGLFLIATLADRWRVRDGGVELEFDRPDAATAP